MKKRKGLRAVGEFLATGFFVGYIPVAPGTFGTLVGAGLYAAFSRFPFVYYPLVAVLSAVAVWVSGYAEREIFRRKDPPHVVIDEIAGFLVAMISFPFDGSPAAYGYLLIGFVLFRALDIWKPYPIRQSQKIGGGLGIVIDDLLAGVYTNLFLQALRIIGSLASR